MRTGRVRLAIGVFFCLCGPASAQAPAAPAVSAGLAIDTSGSMGAKWANVLEVGDALLGALQPPDEVFLLEFNNQPNLRQDFTDDFFLVRQGLKHLWVKGNTTLYDAVRAALYKLREGRQARKALFLISDGHDDRSTCSLTEAIELTKSYQIPIYAVGIGNPEAWNPWLNPLTLVSTHTDKRVMSEPLQQLTT